MGCDIDGLLLGGPVLFLVRTGTERPTQGCSNGCFWRCYFGGAWNESQRMGGYSKGWERGPGPRRGQVRGTPNRPLLQNPPLCVRAKDLGHNGTSLTLGLHGIISIRSKATRDTRGLQFVSGLHFGERRDFKVNRLRFKVQPPTHNLCYSGYINLPGSPVSPL